MLRITKEDLYELGTKYGRLPQLYARSQFTVCVQNFVDEGDVPQHTIPLHFATNNQLEETGGHGQGFVHCNCSKKCLKKNCSCRRRNLLCNSKCHKSSSCANLLLLLIYYIKRYDSNFVINVLQNGRTYILDSRTDKILRSGPGCIET